MPIELHIEELVLHGFAPGNRHEIADATREALVQLLTRQVLSPEAMVEHGTIDAGSFEVISGERGERIGAQVAQSVYQGLSQAMQSGSSVET